ncbi:MAG TPA: SUMF1/EgtB/PvdO family nonheme iron enzyme [Dehalococcoidia bacterium]|nr:SUMF1/EgtB/PvdO family nonheme iron enzyme [Dehalococcoidia bacterium]
MTASDSPAATLLPDLVALPGGWFTLGSRDGRPDERPPRRLWLPPFALARTPVANHEYAAFVAACGRPPRFWRDPRFTDPAQPVVGVRWQDAVDYCAWLSARTGRRLRLPTEAEWEYAARGGVEGGLYPWGNGLPLTASGLPLADAPMDRPAPAGSGPANPFGLRDMGWNVHEWCGDWYAADAYATLAERDPRGPAAGTRRVSRGGAWRHQVKVSRCAARSAIPPAFEYNDYGFRVCAELE